VPGALFVLCRQSLLDEKERQGTKCKDQRYKVQRTEFIPCFTGVYATVHSVLNIS